MQTRTAPSSWHVLLVKPRTERKVGQLLAENGFEICVPVQKQLRQWSDRKKLVEVVLFNNYVFVSLDSRQIKEIARYRESCRLVKFGDRIATLSKAEVSMIRQLSLLAQPVTIEYREFQPGETVEICSGPLAGQRGRLCSSCRPCAACCQIRSRCHRRLRR